MNDTDAPLRIAPVSYRPAAGATGTRFGVSPKWIALIALGLCALLAGLFFTFARAVTIQLTPANATLDLDGGLGMRFGAGHLLLPGDYQLAARAEGHVPLDVRITVGEAREQQFSFALAPLPGRLSVTSEPPAELYVDGNPRGQTPIAALELSAGRHALLLRAPRHLAHEAHFEIEGRGVEQSLRVTLVPGWAPVSLRSKPAQAEILVDGQPAGRTPATLELGAGAHELALRLPGYATWRDTITVLANQPLDLPEIKLAPAAGALKLTSTPKGASVRVDDAFRGQTPLDLSLAPDTPHRVQLSAPGHRSAERTVSVAAEASDALHLALEPVLGRIAFDVQPADAELKIDGEVLAPGTRSVELVAVAHRVEASKPGYAPHSSSITPRADFEQRVQIVLKSEAEARAERVPPRLSSKAGPSLVLVPPGTFLMGTPRGEQGRQANEAERPVRLTRAFYLATTETTNAQFRKFASTHSSGIIRRQTLDNERQPVARVSWAEAARYCNWLSRQDGLPPAYREEGGTLLLVQPVTTGYRLPSEAEWEWAARYAGSESPRRFPWGTGFPPPPESGNFAGAEAESVAAAVLAGYSDGELGAAPVARYAPTPLGLHDLAGNVAEWVHDGYDPTLPISPPEVSDPFGAEGKPDRVIRGSSWLHGRLVELRTNYRDHGREARPDLGFRVARYAE